ncbi:uncharacterized protein BDR25DRAFT_375890 [Lindgomyces ingoldianus]|uniref:Uncharacterized protein n=1 Tax=Lindgomyces ingoldianus TaxID=673940 RepID=A0ACB6RBR4_9PLEO|nr:uncharacterized protein BDR25DRAFT_375890 [Lindgomyces ingoldianus]KAF2476764.1 hypothetical protein BDR25DRAFT_375890 [Lindgomyces ingoldianus]
MAASFEQALQSPIFTFIIGLDRRPIVVHTGVIANISEPLNRLISGPMKEAQDQRAELPDIEKDDFLRLCEFAYKGNYSLPPEWNLPKDKVSCSGNLLAHTKLYCLADKYLVKSLKKLARDKLHHTLVWVAGLYKCRGAVAELASVIYSGDLDVPDGLKQVVVTHLAKESVLFEEDRAIKELIEGSGSFAVDLWRAMVEDKKANIVVEVESDAGWDF